MFHNVTCPACQHRYRIDEAEMGSRQVCPNCRSPFFAGKSVADGRPATAAAAASGQPNYAKTMLTDQGPPPIKYNCPRCGTALEAAANEAGSKINCPKCTQRHQIPQPKPAAVAAEPNVNKTMLAGDDSAAPPRPPIKYNCPACKKPLEAPAELGGTKTNCPACQQRLQIPAAPAVPNRNKTMLAGDESAGPAGARGGYAAAHGAAATNGAGAAGTGKPQWLTPLNVAIGVIVVLLLLLIVPAVIRGGKEENKEFVKWQMELEKMKGEIELKKAEMERQAKLEEEKRRQFDEQIRQARAEEQRRRDDEQRRLQALDEEDRRAAEKKVRLERERREAEIRDREAQYKKDLDALKAQQEETKKALEAKAQQQTVIQQAAPPPVVYVPPYNPYYYRPPWWW